MNTSRLGVAVLSETLSSSSGVPCRAPSGVDGSPIRMSVVGVSGGLAGLGSDDAKPRTCKLSAALIRPGNSSRPTRTSPRYMKSIRAATSRPGKSFNTITGCLQGCSANILSKKGLQALRTTLCALRLVSEHTRVTSTRISAWSRASKACNMWA